MTEKLEKKVGCINQLVRPRLYIKIEGYGNCQNCISDEKNKECRGYYPITIYHIEVKK